MTTTGSITIEGREFRIEHIEPRLCDDNLDENNGGGYLLHGARGARYRTMRNVNNPHHMFLINDKGFTRTCPQVWLSDEGDTLRVVKLI